MLEENAVEFAPSPRTLETSAPARFFEQLHRTFLAARAGVRGASADLEFDIGGYRVRLCFAGPALIPRMTPALASRAAAPGPAPDLTIRLCDSRSTRTPMPAPPWSPADYRARGEIGGFNQGAYRTVYTPGAGTLCMLDLEADEAIFWIEHADGVPSYETAAPLRPILHWWMRRRGLQLTHAAAVGLPQAGVLIAGRGGSGKSTVALSCLTSALTYAGDDYVLLAAGPQPRVYNLYGSAKLDPGHLKRFRHLRDAAADVGRLDEEKAMFWIDQAFPGKVAAGFPLRAILVPRIAGGTGARLRSIGRSRALLALAPSTIFQLPGARGTDFARLAAIAGSLPSHELELGSNLAEIPKVILDLLKPG